MKNLFFLTTLVAFSALAENNSELLDRLVRDEKFGTVHSVYKTPTIQTTISAEYDLTEFSIKPGEVLYFYVPENLSKMPLSQIGFAHRQIGYAPSYDYTPGLTSALVYTNDIPGDELRYWGGHSSGKLGAKFAEYRGSPEFDALFEWPLKGHKGVLSKNKSTDLIHANAVRIQNTGSDKVSFSKLYIEVLPTKADSEHVLIFTPNSDFGDATTMKGRNYGGGQKLRGLFPKSLRLSSKDHSTQPTLPPEMKIEMNKLLIDLPVGKQFSSVEIMCGDTYPDQVKNKDKGWGSLGSAQVSVSIENTLTQETRMLLTEKNVGPEGVITASEVDSKTLIKEGDRLVITNKWKKSTVYIMGLRIGFNIR